VTEQLQIRQCKLDGGGHVAFDGTSLVVEEPGSEGTARANVGVAVTPGDLAALQWVLTGRQARRTSTKGSAGKRPAPSETKGGVS
jgi:hypothetical protein